MVGGKPYPVQNLGKGITQVGGLSINNGKATAYYQSSDTTSRTRPHNLPFEPAPVWDIATERHVISLSCTGGFKHIFQDNTYRDSLAFINEEQFNPEFALIKKIE